ncbi:MAG: 4-(cytidine 5'-diphospho)-2-C-methyl-D-erythritol kinase [Candidatus Omnitrophota bacterium]
MKSTIIKAPAKVNLYLDVINKRPDGYHNIETIFERIDLCDWIKIAVIPKDIKVECAPCFCKNLADNTAFKAAKVLLERHNIRCGFRIQIDKRIPIAAGLGGGSSNAASVLLGINNLLNLGLNRDNLIKLAAAIGADVPFFVSQYSRAFAAGIGDELSLLKQGQKTHFLLVKPAIKILTYSVYNKLDLIYAKKPKISLTKLGGNANIFSHYLRGLTASEMQNALYNKLEEVVLPSYPVLRGIKKALKTAGAEGILVSGSGSTVFGTFTSRKEAARAEGILRKKGNWELFLATSY